MLDLPGFNITLVFKMNRRKFAFTSITTLLAAVLASVQVNASDNTEIEKTMIDNKAKVIALIDSFNSGDPAPIDNISKQSYIQHNLDVPDGLEGLLGALKNAPPEGFSSKIHRVIADGPFVVAHVEYDFFGPKAGFDVFRFEDGLIVEHWDNLSEITPPNPSGRTQFDGSTEITDFDATDKNKKIVTDFVNEILVGGQTEKITQYVSTEQYLQHNSSIADGLDGLGDALAYFAENDLVLQYDTLHKVLGEGNFVLTMSEGKFGRGEHVAYYDLFRLEKGLIVEHWDVIQSIPPEAEWKNQNGKF